MNIFNDVYQWLIEAVKMDYNLDHIDFSKVVVEPTKDARHGDLATNVAMVLSKQLSCKPQELAQKIIVRLNDNENILKIEIAGPGFINMTMKPSFWHETVTKIWGVKESFGKPHIENPEEILVEFVSVNPTGPLHAGHGRNAIYGDTLASLLEFCGHKVTREYYINDAGGQVDALGESAILRYKQALGQDISDDQFGPDMYRGDYLNSVGSKLKEKYGDTLLSLDHAKLLQIVKDFSVVEMMDQIKDDLDFAHIIMDVYTSEKEVISQGHLDRMLKNFEEAGLIYNGVLAAPLGITVDDWEEKPQLLFKATQFGDDVDRALQKSDKSWTYFAGDVGYHYYKIQRGFKKLLNIFGADHIGYVKRLKAAVSAMSDTDTLDVRLTQMVNFVDGGKPVRMSKRSGNFITFRDVLERVGINATRYLMLSRHHDMALDFDFDLVVSHNKDNPVFYVNYAYARMHSVIKQMTKTFPHIAYDKSLEKVALDLLVNDEEIALIKEINNWPRVLQMAYVHKEPHRIIQHLYQLAYRFSVLWNAGRENSHLRFIDPKDLNISLARLKLIQTNILIFKIASSILKIELVEEMN
ncbi:MAG: arginine--tRNA ligase [Candidatus Puniceispirillum sp.]|nr:arginine--tRNA ligase [Candidatus Pelagibacter sp.]MBA4283139.1 arginine--tRNA ligase [Candidatus Puniceispirillum sp.]